MRKTFASLIAVALFAAPALAGEFNKVVSIGQKAPAFAGIPATTPDGQSVSLTLSDMKDDIIVLVFLANHCPVVTQYEDRIIDFAKDYEDKGVKVVAVAVTGGELRKQDDLNAIRQRVKDKGYSFVYGFDETQKIGRDYGATNTPQFFVLDKDRVIRYMGAMDDNAGNEAAVKKQYLRDAVDALLAGKEIEVKETRPVGCGVKYDR
ncbi:MAG: thioredoxin family protein [Isosphaeraceae bacterium]|jgi:alkyl hydroperoxide reductase subunit AhpC|nr:MAG: thioredoxin family protein [Isosphaeraceae bacterium]